MLLEQVRMPGIDIHEGRPSRLGVETVPDPLQNRGEYLFTKRIEGEINRSLVITRLHRIAFVNGDSAPVWKTFCKSVRIFQGYAAQFLVYLNANAP